MIKEIIAQGKNVMEAKENARAALGVDELAEVNYEILHGGSNGIFGIIGVKPAKVRAWMELPDAPARERRSERRAPERSEAAAPAEKLDKGEKAERAEKPERKRNDRPERKPEGQKKPKAPRAPQPQKPRSEVIPEANLKLTPMEKAPGEDCALDFVNTLIANLQLDATAAIFSAEDGSRRIIISGEGASSLIGHHGDTLDSLQYLANLACARPNAKGERDNGRVTVDIEGYRAKREETLRALARRMAEKSLRQKRNVTLEPMNPYERRIIHDEVSRIAGVTTSSIGSDTSRRVVIFFDRSAEGKPAPEADETATPVTLEIPPILDEGDTDEGTPVEFAPDPAIETENTPADADCHE